MLPQRGPDNVGTLSADPDGQDILLLHKEYAQ